MILSTSIQAFAAGTDTSQAIVDYEITAAPEEVSSRAGNRPCSVLSSTVYPAYCDTLQYFDAPTTAKGNSQWCNVTLSATAASVYKQNNCDGFYVVASIYAETAKTYKLYINGDLAGQGSVPSQNISLKLLVKNENPANWRLVLYDVGDTTGIPVWGYIYL